MTLTQNVYNILVAASLTVPEIWAGSAATNTTVTSGLLTFFQLPSAGASFADGTSNILYQFDIWDKDIYQAEEYKEEVVMALLGFADIVDGKAMIFNMDSEGGVLIEEDTGIYHYTVTFSIKYARR